MIGRKNSRVIWHNHLSAVSPTEPLRTWLSLNGSLTAGLQRNCGQFYVQCIKQRKEHCLRDDVMSIGLSRPKNVTVREVLLFCDDRPVVFARTAIAPYAEAASWPVLKRLGNASLGSFLFADHLVKKGNLQFARFSPSHILARRVCSVLPELAKTTKFHARRCLYLRKRGAMLVTEIFLPEISRLSTRLMT